ncbi:hypothetical protein BHM03_00002554 [Ensete ventricosum]|nr:hypothetical protein BHM03_00002554 [Ensete ventricosum]
MRRLARADSPEVVRVSEASPESSFRELDDVFLQVLCLFYCIEGCCWGFQVSKVVWKMLLKKHVELKSSKIFIYERTSFAKHNGKYMPYPKVDSFLKVHSHYVVEKRDTRRVCYSGQHDQSHEYCSESDEAESSFNGIELESPSSNVSYDASNIFNLDGEVFAQGSLGDDNSSKLHVYFELEGQTRGEDGHNSEHHGKELPGALSCLLVGNDDSQGKDSSVHQMRTADQAIDCGQCFLPTPGLVRDEAAKVSNNDNFQRNNLSAGNFLFAADLCMSTSGESSEQTLNVEERNIGHIHSSPPTGVFSVHDTACACLQHVDESIPYTAYKNLAQTKNDIAGRSCVNNLDPYHRNETSGMVTGGAIVTTNTKLSCSRCSKDLPDMEYMFSDNATEGTSDRSYFSVTLSTLGPACHSSTVHTGAPAEFGNECTGDQASFSCSNHEILAEAIGDMTAETNSEVRHQAHLTDDVGTTMDRMVPDVDEEIKKVKLWISLSWFSVTFLGKTSLYAVLQIRCSCYK